MRARIGPFSYVALLIGVPLVLVPVWFLTHDVAFVASTAVTVTAYGCMHAHVHGAMHTPRDRLIERTRWFRWLDEHHYIHHVDMRANVNFALPIFDFILGTRRAALTEVEQKRHPYFADAKIVPAAPAAQQRSAA